MRLLLRLLIVLGSTPSFVGCTSYQSLVMHDVPGAIVKAVGYERELSTGDVVKLHLVGGREVIGRVVVATTDSISIVVIEHLQSREFAGGPGEEANSVPPAILTLATSDLIQVEKQQNMPVGVGLTFWILLIAIGVGISMSSANLGL
jgi:hypothetical protein